MAVDYAYSIALDPCLDVHNGKYVLDPFFLAGATSTRPHREPIGLSG